MAIITERSSSTRARQRCNEVTGRRGWTSYSDAECDMVFQWFWVRAYRQHYRSGLIDCSGLILLWMHECDMAQVWYGTAVIWLMTCKNEVTGLCANMLSCINPRHGSFWKLLESSGIFSWFFNGLESLENQCRFWKSDVQRSSLGKLLTVLRLRFINRITAYEQDKSTKAMIFWHL